jgi:hypothetical protein
MFDKPTTGSSAPMVFFITGAIRMRPGYKDGLSQKTGDRPVSAGLLLSLEFIFIEPG